MDKKIDIKQYLHIINNNTFCSMYPKMKVVRPKYKSNIKNSYY